MRDVAVGDLDGDGDLDIVALDSISVPGDFLYRFEHLDGAGAFGPAQLVETGLAAYTVETVDLDRDGDTDILAGMLPGFGALYYWWRNDGAVGFGIGRPTSTSAGASTVAVGLAIGDLDRDGLPDVAGGYNEIVEVPPYTLYWGRFWLENTLDDCDGNGVLDACQAWIATGPAQALTVQKQDGSLR